MVETTSPPDLMQSVAGLLWLVGPAGFGALAFAIFGFMRQRRAEGSRLPATLALYTDRSAIDDHASAMRRVAAAIENGNDVAREQAVAAREQTVALRELARAQRERTEVIEAQRMTRRRERSPRSNDSG